MSIYDGTNKHLRTAEIHQKKIKYFYNADHKSLCALHIYFFLFFIFKYLFISNEFVSSTNPNYSVLFYSWYFQNIPSTSWENILSLYNTCRNS